MFFPEPIKSCRNNLLVLSHFVSVALHEQQKWEPMDNLWEYVLSVLKEETWRIS